ncbi:D-tyrosyl-tRNA(Tyr) deacylase [bacterium SCSIO 12643]|nr:D-tyrosyl-tRNA(Tyr) deacylase [bacterium SCSIO 12643]
MRSVIQRVTEAKVSIKGKKIGAIQQGYVVLLGVEDADTIEDVKWLASKIYKLRLFSDEDGKMNLNIRDVKGNILVISQFTLHAKTKKGNRPSYIKAGRPEHANKLYEDFIDELFNLLDQPIQSGEFGGDMQISMTNDGPVTIIIDTKNKE